MKNKYKIVIDMNSLKRWLLPLFLMSVLIVNAQSVKQSGTLTGIVLDIEGEPLIGVSIGVAGTTIGTSTDVDGKYKLENVKENMTIVFSYVGYHSEEIKYTNQSTQNIVLREKTKELQDVVVVGYGTQKKTSVTGALSQISPQALEKVPSVTLSNTLGGALPGIITRQSTSEPGKDNAAIFIRGMATWGDKSPLILIDGVERDLNLINVAEIDNFTILKDASATAVYGVRGANGVILVNTKKGKMGKPKVTLRSEFALLHGLRFPKYINGYEFASLMNEATQHATGSSHNLPWTGEELDKFRTGSDPYLYPSVNWTDEILKKNAFQTVHNLSITGGSETIRYYTNVGYSSQTGLFKEDPQYKYRTNSKSDRYNFRSNIDINVAKTLLLGLSLGGIIQDKTYPGTNSDEIFAQMRQISPIQMPKQNPNRTPGSGPSEIYLNPWALATQTGYSSYFTNTLQGTFNAKWDLSELITKGLSVSGKFSYDFFYENATTRYIKYGMDRYLGTDSSGEDLYQNVRNAESMKYSSGSNSNRAYYYDLGVNYEKAFGLHSVSGMALFNRRDYKHLTAGTSILNLPYRRQGLAARFTYNYNHKYLGEFNFGYNGSENFKKGSRYGFFPSFSGGWVVSEEKFMKNILGDTYIKLRGSYGIVGNDQIGGDRFLYLSTVNTSANGGLFGESQQPITGYAEAKLGADVTWEKSYKLNGGFEVKLLKNALSLQADFFVDHRKDILLSRGGIPSSVGISSQVYANLGEVKNKGIDAMIEYKHTTKTGLYISGYANFTYAFNRIIEDDTPLPKYDYQDTRGRRIDQYFGYVSMGFFESQEEIDDSPVQTFMTNVRPGDIRYVDINGDGKIDSYDKVPIGYARVPEIMYGFGFTVAYKGFDMTLGFTGAARTSMYLNSEDMWPFSLEYPRYNVSREYYDNRWVEGQNNSHAKYPAVINGNNPNNYVESTQYLRDASYLKLKNAEIGYNFSEKVTKSLKIEGLRFFVNGTNLLCFDKLKIVDPEADYGTGNYPQQRTINTGIQINF